MELKQLEYFREIADNGSINEAARRLNMSQPPLSYQLQQLEGELNVRLFDRSSQGVALTEAGKLLYDRAGELLNYARSTAQEVAGVGKKRVLRIGITSTTVGTMMPHFARFTRAYPDVRYEIRDGNTFSLYNKLMEGIIDVSVVRTPLRLDDVAFSVLHTEPMIAVSLPGADAETQPVRLAALSGCRLVLYRRYEKLILHAFHARRLEPDVFCMCDDARDALLWAREGLATAIFPRSMATMCTGLCIREIEEPLLETQIVLIRRRDKKPPQIVRDFLEICARG